MKNAILALLSIVALLGLVLPSSAITVNRDTNANRLARGLPPNPPTRRTAPKPRTSSSPTTCVQVRDVTGQVLGYLDNGHGNDGLTIQPTCTFPVIFNPSTGTINNGAHYFGGHKNPGVTLSATSGSTVDVQKVSINNGNSESSIWSLNNGELAATWTNPNGGMVTVDFVQSGTTVEMTGSPILAGLPVVTLWLVTV